MPLIFRKLICSPPPISNIFPRAAHLRQQFLDGRRPTATSASTAAALVDISYADQAAGAAGPALMRPGSAAQYSLLLLPAPAAAATFRLSARRRTPRPRTSPPSARPARGRQRHGGSTVRRRRGCCELHRRVEYLRIPPDTPIADTLDGQQAATFFSPSFAVRLDSTPEIFTHSRRKQIPSAGLPPAAARAI